MTSHDAKREVVGFITLLRVVALLSLLTMLVGIAHGASPPQGTERKIVSDDFTKNRKEGTPANSNSKSQGQSSSNVAPKPRPPRTYRPASQQATKMRPASTGVVVAQLGITVWRLRPLTSADKGHRQLARENGDNSEWTRERIEAETPLREGDRVRLSIESPRSGYLYVVDRDWLADGTTGETKLIFPILGDDNYVHAGRLIDIPAQDYAPFKATPKPNQAGEILTIIVVAAKLDFPLSHDPLPIPTAELEKWEKMWGGESERFEMEGGAGEAWTQQEQKAAAKKGTRQLTRDDPAPQTIYRVSGTTNKGFLVNVRLRYAK